MIHTIRAEKLPEEGAETKDANLEDEEPEK